MNRTCCSESLTFLLVFIAACGALPTTARADESLPPMQELKLTSSIGKTAQPCLLWVTHIASQRPTPVLIWLHSWSFDYRQKDALAYQAQAVKRGWILLLPNFRGKNNNPKAG